MFPVLGKVYEKVINKRVLGSLEKGRKLQDRQYGFRPGRGTEGALVEVMDRVRASDKTYLAAVFLDIGGAFDNAWWPRIIVQLKDFGIRGEELEVIKDYFRFAILKFRGVQQEKRLNKGCPQGCVFGPTLCVILSDAFLRLRLARECQLFACTDDGMLLVEPSLRRKLE